jgi:hypothetical protein
VYRTHARSILLFLARRTTDEEMAAWLFGIARHVLARYFRRGSAERRALERVGIEVPPLEQEDFDRIVELAGLHELRSTVARELGALPEQHREAPGGGAAREHRDHRRAQRARGNEVSTSTKALQIEVAPRGSAILESHR